MFLWGCNIIAYFVAYTAANPQVGHIVANRCYPNSLLAIPLLWAPLCYIDLINVNFVPSQQFKVNVVDGWKEVFLPCRLIQSKAKRNIFYFLQVSTCCNCSQPNNNFILILSTLRKENQPIWWLYEKGESIPKRT